MNAYDWIRRIIVDVEFIDRHLRVARLINSNRSTTQVALVVLRRHACNGNNYALSFGAVNTITGQGQECVTGDAVLYLFMTHDD